MKTKQELLSMLFARLTELEDESSKNYSEAMLTCARTELALLYDILEDDIEEEWWERINQQIDVI